jgi:hypothetical protein
MTVKNRETTIPVEIRIVEIANHNNRKIIDAQLFTKIGNFWFGIWGKVMLTNEQI